MKPFETLQTKSLKSLRKIFRNYTDNLKRGCDADF